MKRTTIMLPEELRTRAQKRARRDGLSLAKLIRQALETTLADPAKASKKDPFFADQIVWQNKAPKDGSTNHDKYLYDDPL